MSKTINIIGCGHVGQTLGRLWSAAGVFTIQDVLNRSEESGQKAVAFMQAGRVLAGLADMQAADIYLIATPDDHIKPACEALARTGLLKAGSIVFHCSGALLSSELESAAQQGAVVASTHPVRSFAAPAQLVDRFTGTFCGVEGNAAALQVLNEAFIAIGAIPLALDPGFKTVYHAAAVFASNYLVTLLDVAQQAYAKAGVPPEQALQLMEPLVRGTMENVFKLGTTDALTGPIARGDIATAVKQYRAVNAWDDEIGALYRQFSKLTADIAARRPRRS